MRSFDPPSERRLSESGTGSGFSHDVSPDGKEVIFLALPSGTQPSIWNQESKTLRPLPLDLADWRYDKGPSYPLQRFNVH